MLKRPLWMHPKFARMQARTPKQTNWAPAQKTECGIILAFQKVISKASINAEYGQSYLVAAKDRKATTLQLADHGNLRVLSSSNSLGVLDGAAEQEAHALLD